MTDCYFQRLVKSRPPTLLNKYHEDTYKRVASSLTHELLDDWVSKDPSTLPSYELTERIEKIFRKRLPNLPEPQNLTGWRDNQFILDDLLSTERNRDLLSQHLRPLLRKASTNENIDNELANFLEWLTSSQVRPAITKNFPSLILFYWNPDRFIFIKPRVFDKFLVEIGQKPLGQGKKLTVGEYNRVLEIMLSFKGTISKLHPRDMIDIQSFYYVVTAYSDEHLPNYTIEDVPSELTDLEDGKDSYQELNETEREAIISSRIGQGLYRANLIEYWKGCAVTGCKNLDILIASHIKPWKNCSNEERLDTHNGLLLVPNLDKLFDKGLVTFQDSGEIQISSKLSNDDLAKLNINPFLRIRRELSPKQQHYLHYHRKEKFKS